MDTVRWLRVIGDTIFSAGVVALVLFTLGLATGQSLRRKTAARLPVVPAPTRV